MRAHSSLLLPHLRRLRQWEHLQGILTGLLRLHGGAHQLMHEAAALAAASRRWGTDAIQVRDFSIRFVKPAMRGPFEARASVLSASATDLLCQVVLIDRGADDPVRSLSTMRIGMAKSA